jgi:hypothetical protein
MVCGVGCTTVYQGSQQALIAAVECRACAAEQSQAHLQLEQPTHLPFCLLLLLVRYTCRNLCQKSGATAGTCTNKFCPLAADVCDSGRQCSPRAGNVGACLLSNNVDICPIGSIPATNRACASGRGCNGTANVAKCLPCDSKSCTGNFECDSQSGVCKCKAGRNCCSRDAHCQGPATCVLPSQSCGGRGTCLLNVGHTCSKDWQCGALLCAGGKCECDKKSKECRLKAGRRCKQGSNECLTDLTCGTRAGDSTSRCLLPLGAKRCDWRQQCAGTTAGDTFCDTSKDGDRACLLKVNSKCLYNGGKSYCGDGTRCYKDGVGTAELCSESDSSCTCKCPQEKSCCNVADHCAVPGPAVVGTVVCKGGTCDTA